MPELEVAVERVTAGSGLSATIASRYHFRQWVSFNLPNLGNEPLSPGIRNGHCSWQKRNSVMRASLGSMILIPAVAVAFAACDTTSPSNSVSRLGVNSGDIANAGNVGQDGEQRPATMPITSTDSEALVATAIPEGIAKLNGRYYQVRSGKATLLDQRERFAEGISFEPNGRITLQDGRIVRLHEREMVTFGGDRRDAPRNIEMPSPLPRNTTALNG